MKFKLKIGLIALLAIGIVLASGWWIWTNFPSEPLPFSGIIEIYFSPDYILGDTPSDTQKNISRFIKSTNLEISITYIRDPNMRSFMVIWKKDINQDLIDRVKKDPLVSDFIVGAYIKSPSGSGPTYQIRFKEGLYNETLWNFVNKYPEVKNNLEVDYFSLPLESVMATAKVPIGKEEEYINELKSKYPNEVIEVKRFVPGII